MIMDLGLMMKAVAFYGRTIEMISVPYLADPDILAFTCPPSVVDQRLTHFNGKQYVASAEQSFLQMEKDGFEFACANPYMALTPCYRTEPVLDSSHFNIFLKLEIFELYPLNRTSGDLDYALLMQDFFLTVGVKTEIVQTDIGYDVESMEGLELGSFGYRYTPEGHLYIYATGLAEPRASLALRGER